MYCPKCGKEMKEGDKFCRYCGYESIKGKEVKKVDGKGRYIDEEGFV